MKVLIVDDEPLARRGLREELSRMPGVVCVGECARCDEAVSAIVDRRPDVVLLDIQLGKSTAFEIIEQIGAEAMPVVVFVTAFDRYALRAFEAQALDYVLKPVDPERLREAIGRAAKLVTLQRGASVVDRLEGLLAARMPGLPASPATPSPVSRLVVRDGEELRFVNTEHIEWLESAGNSILVHCTPTPTAAAQGRSYKIRTTMERIARRLAGNETFIRVRHSALVNIKAVVSLERYGKGMYVIRLRSGGRVISSRYHQAELRHHLQPDE